MNINPQNLTISEWLRTSPDEKELEFYDEEGKIRYVPYDIVKAKLDYLTGDKWGSKNFSHFFFTMPDGRVFVSGSIDIVVTYPIDNTITTRILSGSATFDIKEYDNEDSKNPHYGATCKSLAIVNAAQVLGKTFGWGINDVVKKKKSKKVKKEKAGAIEVQKMKIAMSAKDEKQISELNNNYIFDAQS